MSLKIPFNFTVTLERPWLTLALPSSKKSVLVFSGLEQTQSGRECPTECLLIDGGHTEDGQSKTKPIWPRDNLTWYIRLILQKVYLADWTGLCISSATSASNLE